MTKNESMQIGILIERVENLTERINHNCKVSDNNDKCILENIKELKGDFGTKIELHEAKVSKMFNNHSNYHKENEDKWGPVTYMKNHLKQTVIITLIIGIILASTGLVTVNTVKDLINKKIATALK